MSILSHAPFVRLLLSGSILISAACSVAVALDDPPADFNKLQRQMRAAYRAGDYDSALKSAGKMHELQPDNAGVIYNIACLHCLMGKKAKSYEWMEKAIDAGFADAALMSSDADLGTLQGEDRFRNLLKRVRAAKAPGDGRKSDRAAKEKGDSADRKPPKRSPEELAAEVNRLTQQLIAAAEDEDYDKALQIAMKANDLADNALTNYNVACMYSQLKKKDDAFTHLGMAIEKGGFPRDLAEQMEGDTDLDNIRKDQRYAELLAKARKADKTDSPKPGAQRVAPKWIIVAPEALGRSSGAPLVVVLHPYRGNMESTANKWKHAAGEVGAVLLAPQGTSKIADHEYEWGQNLDEIESNVSAAIEKAMDDDRIDKDKIILAGFSQGAWAAWHMALRNPDAYRGVIPVCGRCDDIGESAFEDEDAGKLRVFIMLGADENERILSTNRAAAKRLEKAGAGVKLNTYKGVGHDYPEDSTEEMIKALKFVLGRL